MFSLQSVFSISIQEHLIEGQPLIFATKILLVANLVELTVAKIGVELLAFFCFRALSEGLPSFPELLLDVRLVCFVATCVSIHFRWDPGASALR